MREGHKDLTRLRHMIDSLDRLDYLLKGVQQNKFMEDFTIHIAAERLLEIIGEASARITESFKERYQQVPWNEMRNLRNIISHEYFDVDYRVLWDIIQNDLPPLKKQLTTIFENEET